MSGICPICDGEEEDCAELGSHEWISCRGCGIDIRPEFGWCPDCNMPTGTPRASIYPPRRVIRGTVQL